EADPDPQRNARDRHPQPARLLIRFLLYLNTRPLVETGHRAPGRAILPDRSRLAVGTGADLMKRIGAPLVGGITTSFLLELTSTLPSSRSGKGGGWRGRGRRKRGRSWWSRRRRIACYQR